MSGGPNSHGFLIVVIELPKQPRTLHPGYFTSVNLSGSANIVRDNGWPRSIGETSPLHSLTLTRQFSMSEIA